MWYANSILDATAIKIQGKVQTGVTYLEFSKVTKEDIVQSAKTVIQYEEHGTLLYTFFF